MSTVSNVVDTWGDETVSNSAVTQGFIDEQSYRKDSRPIAVCASGSAGGSKPKVSAPAVVRDDWEMDDEAEEEDSRPTDERNKQIWENANNQEHHPMPSLVIARGSSSIPATPSLPLNQPPAMRILKRPSPSQSPSQSSTNLSSNGETFQQREARYQAARERIFGVSNEGSQDSGQKKNSSQKSLASPTPPPNPAAAIVMREPRGPSNSLSGGQAVPQNKGFGERKAKRPPPPTTKALSSTTTSISP